jgi:stearoyl-CoA desaturase (delta-9 desaturase)
VLFKGAVLYNQAAKDTGTLAQYGMGTPDDWIEKNLYSKYQWLGIVLLLAVNLAVFGIAGLVVWTVQMLWIPFWAAGVINGIGHWWGYRNTDTKDTSRNILPIDFIVGGECLHNNHHSDPASPKLSRQWFEFDLGWAVIKLLCWMRMAELRPVDK